MATADPHDVTRSVLVENISQDTTEELLQLFFENSKRSGGGPIEDISFNGNSALIQFKSKEVAERVLNRRNVILNNNPLRISPAPSSLHTTGRSVVVTGFGSATKDLLELWFENVNKSGGGAIEEITFDASTKTAVVTFEEAAVASRVLAQQHALNGIILNVRPTTEKDSPGVRVVTVTGFSVKTARDTIELYFGSAKRSGGGEMEKFDFEKSRRRAVITFKRDTSATTVVNRKHILDETSLTVVLGNPSDSPKQAKARRLVVSGFSPKTAEDTVRLFFENRRLSGGGVLDSFTFDPSRRMATLSYADENTATTVLSNSSLNNLKLHDACLRVRLSTDLNGNEVPDLMTCPVVCEPMKFILRNVPRDVDKANVRQYFAKVTDIGVKTIWFSYEFDSVLLVEFSDKPAFEDLGRFCATTALNGRMVEIEQLPLPHTVEVHNVNQLSLERLQQYFKSETESRGGEIADIHRHPEIESCVLVKFVEWAAAKRVLQHEKHSVDGHNVVVFVHYAEFGIIPPGYKVTNNWGQTSPSFEVILKDAFMFNFLRESRWAKQSIDTFGKAKSYMVDWENSNVDRLRCIHVLNRTVTRCQVPQTNDWRKNCSNELEKWMSGITCQEIPISDDLFEDVMDDMEAEDGHTVLIIPDRRNKTIQIVGSSKMVLEEKRRCEDITYKVRESRMETKDILPLTPLQSRLLKMTDIPESIRVVSPQLSCEIDTHECIIRGKRKEVEEVSSNVRKSVADFKSQVISCNAARMELLKSMQAYMMDLFAANRLKVTITFEQNKVVFHGLDYDDIERAINILDQEIAEFTIPIDKTIHDIVKTFEWKEYRKSLEEEHRNNLIITYGLNDLSMDVACSAHLKYDIHSAIISGLGDQTTDEVFFTTSETNKRLLENFHSQRLKDIEQQITGCQVSIEASSDKSKCGFILKGPRNKLSEVKRDLSTLIQKIRVEEYQTKHPTRTNELLSSAGEDHIKAKEMTHRVVCDVLRPKDMHDGETTEADKARTATQTSQMKLPRVTGFRRDTSGKAVTPEGVTISLNIGSLLDEKVDVIVNSTAPDLNLSRGGVSAMLARQAGTGIQTECNNAAPNGVQPGTIVPTSAGNIRGVSKIYHVVLEVWNDQSTEKNLTSLLEKCFQKANASGFSSMALPVLGTGNLKYPHNRVASIMFNQVAEYSKSIQNPTLKNICFSIYDKDFESRMAFEKEMQSVTTAKPVASGVGAGLLEGMARPSIMGRSQPGRIFKKQQPVSFRLSGFTQDSVEKMKAGLDEYFDRHSYEHVFSGNNIKLLTREQIDHIELLEAENNVDIKFGDQIIVHGNKDNVSKTVQSISGILDSAQNAKETRDKAEMLKQQVQWVVCHTNGEFVEYPMEINLIIEEAYKQKNDTVEFEQNCKYTVNFKEMKEYKTGDLLHSSDVRRNDKLKASIQLPNEWSTGDHDVRKVEITKGKNWQEYQEVENSFKETCRTLRILKIERIENPSGYKRYIIRKQDMEKRNPPGTQNERFLFHATKVETVEAINANNFDRSYSGTTTGCYYGRGVYFAKDASCSYDYAKKLKDKDGKMYMYRAAVLVGEFTKGEKNQKAPPTKPNSVYPYDTLVDDVRAPQKFVVFHDDSVYPKHLITFKNP